MLIFLFVIAIIYCWIAYLMYTAPFMDDEIESDDDNLF